MTEVVARGTQMVGRSCYSFPLHQGAPLTQSISMASTGITFPVLLDVSVWPFSYDDRHSSFRYVRFAISQDLFSPILRCLERSDACSHLYEYWFEGSVQLSGGCHSVVSGTSQHPWNLLKI